MAAPNILQVSTITGKTDVLAVTTTATALVENAAASGKVLKVNTVIISNINGSAAADITLDLFRNSVAYRLVSTVPVLQDTTFIALGRDYPLYLEEGDALRVTASANSMLTSICSYEVIT